MKKIIRNTSVAINMKHMTRKEVDTLLELNESEPSGLVGLAIDLIIPRRKSLIFDNPSIQTSKLCPKE